MKPMDKFLDYFLPASTGSFIAMILNINIIDTALVGFTFGLMGGLGGLIMKLIWDYFKKLFKNDKNTKE